MRRSFTLTFLALFCLQCAWAQSPLEQIWKSATKSNTNSTANLSTDKIASGLKEALRVSTANAVAKTGKPGGFLNNPDIKIPLPGRMQSVSKELRLVGMGSSLDQLEVGMNRAAEQATPMAKQIFLNSLSKMTISDARNILSGSDTAATEYFKRTSTPDLTTAFKPIVHQQMQKVGVVQQYDQLISNPMAAQLLQARGFDLDNYVVGKSLDGLFFMLGQEEKQIRRNPAAQVTPLLQQVFGSLTKNRQ